MALLCQIVRHCHWIIDWCSYWSSKETINQKACLWIVKRGYILYRWIASAHQSHAPLTIALLSSLCPIHYHFSFWQLVETIFRERGARVLWFMHTLSHITIVFKVQANKETSFYHTNLDTGPCCPLLAHLSPQWKWSVLIFLPHFFLIAWFFFAV